MAMLAAQNGQLLEQLAPLRSRQRTEHAPAMSPHLAGLVEVEHLEAVRASTTSAGSSNRSQEGTRLRGRDAAISLSGSASQLAGRPTSSGSVSARETVSQQTARTRDLQRQRAEASRKRSLVPNYTRLAAGSDSSPQ
jgi:hypothetical protein